jgi:hypothetical protein
MKSKEWSAFELNVRSFCEMRAEYRRRKETGSLGAELEGRMIQALNGLELEIDRMKSGNEIAQARVRHASHPSSKTIVLRKAQ